MKNTLRIKIIIIGGLVSFFSLMMLFQSIFIFEKFDELLKAVWELYMPILSIIGLFYLFFGIFFEKFRKFKLLVHILISIASIIWFIFYFIALEKTDQFSGLNPNENGIASFFYYFGAIIGLLIIVIPQIWIGMKIYNSK